MPLSDVQLRALKRNPTPGRHADGQGLYLRITKTGSMLWQWKIATPRPTTVSYGAYPDVSLAEARERHRIARLQRRDGIEPNAAKRAARAAAAVAARDTWGALATEWLDVMSSRWSPRHLKTTRERIEYSLAGPLSARPVRELAAPELLLVLRKIEERGALETAARCRNILSQVSRFAIATGRADNDPARDLAGALRTSPKGHHAAITTPHELGQLLRAIDGYGGSRVVRSALMLSALTFQRPGEIRGARWDEIDLDRAEWVIAAARMKGSIQTKADAAGHLVPLSRQSLALLRELHVLTGHGPLLFPSTRGQGRCISDSTCLAALRSIGFTQDQHTPHGFRATARTLLDEVLHEPVEVIEAQLAHSVRDSLGRAYNRTTFMLQRRDLMQRWADYLCSLRAGGNLVQLVRVA